MKNEIHIVGAGPAGLTAALTLARAGFKPVVFEQAQDVGQRFHGDFQGLENWSTPEDVLSFLKSIGIAINFRCVPYSGGIFYGPGLERFDIRTNRPWFYLVERGSAPGTLDHGLKQQALDAGVEIRFGRRITHATADKVIVATGPYAADAIARGIVFETSHPDACFGFLDDRIAPRGYAYLLIHQGKATLATCLFDDFPLAHWYLERTLDAVSKVVQLDVRAPRTFGGYANFEIRSSWTRNNRLYFVGERAGFQDALWGFGLRYALWSGYLAARAIIENADYDTWCKQHLVPWIEASLANRLLYSQLGNHGYTWVLRHMANADVLGKLRELYQPSPSKRLLYEIARRRIHPHLREQSCEETSCTCLWCKHGKHMDKTAMEQCVQRYLKTTR